MKLLLVTGSRTWSDAAFIERKLLLYAKHFGDFTLLSGHCPDGADAIAEGICKRLGFDMELIPANWTRYGRTAGGLRNAKMVGKGPDYYLAFLHNNSSGTRDCIRRTKAALIPGKVYRRND